MIELCREKGRIRIILKCIQMGTDFCVMITGGDKPHLGAVALGCSRPSMTNPDSPSSSVSLLTLLGHKEDMLVYKAADVLSSALRTNVVVCCGIHLDQIQGKEISLVINLTRELIEELMKQLGVNSGNIEIIKD